MKKKPKRIAASRSDGKAKKKATRLTRHGPEERFPVSGGKGFYIVGMGASAGGLESFEHFFANMPGDSGMAFVLIPHLDPKHKSLLGDLLTRYTDMKIFEAQEGLQVRPNCVYIIPPNKDMAVSNSRLRLLEPTISGGIRHPIDFFFRSMAEDFKEKSICVILSGTGSEGTAGLKDVKGEGGLVVAQEDPVYNSMPQSAIATGLADYILPAAKMPSQLLKYIRREHIAVPAKTMEVEEKPGEAIQKVLGLILAQTGHDFSQYKENTIIRRIERRMMVHQLKKMSEYVHFLRMNPNEIDILFRELLIRVTNFFREPEAFDAIQKLAFPVIFKNKSPKYTVRIWVPGCSTGEEAYSLAMLADEYLHKRKPKLKIQIFATDIDHGAIESARAGVYSESITVDVTPQRLDRYFIKKGNTYKVKSEIREMVVFAVQNLIKDPPFSKVDMISCRNLLIYLSSDLQKKVMPILHYALNPGGILFLGSSETIGGFDDLFKSLDRKWKIFQAKKAGIARPLPVGIHPYYLPPHPVQQRRETPLAVETAIRETLEPVLMEEYTPPAVVVNGNGDILYVHGKTGKFLEFAAGKASLNIMEVAREGLKLELRAALRKAQTQEKVLIEGINVKSNGGHLRMNLEIRPVQKPEMLEGLMLVLFHEIRPVKEISMPELKEAGSRRLKEWCAALEAELKTNKERLQTTIEELETSNEELKSSNEELQSSNEELQSTNEELATSREEMQSVNEELVTVNTEMQGKVDELAEINSDMSNLLTSTQIGTIFLDNHLNIKRFTPAMAGIINLLDSDVGRPLADIAAAKLQYPELIKDAQEVLKSLVQKEKIVGQKGGRWFLIRLMPYRTVKNVIAGVVITLTDITELKRAREVAEEALSFAEGIINQAGGAMLTLDENFRIMKANRPFYETFRLTPERVEGRHFLELDKGRWDTPGLKSRLERLLAKGTPVEAFRMQYEFPREGKRTIIVNARKFVISEGKTGLFLVMSPHREQKNERPEKQTPPRQKR